MCSAEHSASKCLTLRRPPFPTHSSRNRSKSKEPFQTPVPLRRFRSASEREDKLFDRIRTFGISVAECLHIERLSVTAKKSHFTRVLCATKKRQSREDPVARLSENFDSSVTTVHNCHQISSPMKRLPRWRASRPLEDSVWKYR